MTRTGTYYARRGSATKRVADIKVFHNHLFSYFVLTILFNIAGGEIMEFISRGHIILPADFLEWFNLNFLITSLLWGIVMILHGLYAYWNLLIEVGSPTNPQTDGGRASKSGPESGIIMTRLKQQNQWM